MRISDWSSDVCSSDLQILFLLLGLDAFGNDADIKAARHRDDRIDDRGVGGIVGDVANERAVDLDLVDRKAGQVRKTRIAGAEVVDADRHTEPEIGRAACRERGCQAGYIAVGAG